MKSFRKFLLIGFCVVAACSKKETVVSYPSIVGKWQKTHVAMCAPADGFGGWKEVADGYVIQFMANGTIIDSRNMYNSYGIKGSGDSILLKKLLRAVAINGMFLSFKTIMPNYKLQTQPQVFAL